MFTFCMMVSGWALLAGMLAHGVRVVTPRHLAGAVVVSGVWFGLCLAVLG